MNLEWRRVALSVPPGARSQQPGKTTSNTPIRARAATQLSSTSLLFSPRVLWPHWTVSEMPCTAFFHRPLNFLSRAPAELAIRGVRSFDDKSINIIEFFTPLTVIVGYNGSGKTTIIECLKYVTTGDMPPNTKGGAFVHDPKMAATNEVKAQVRLRFFSTNKTRMNCVRNLQVSVKKGDSLTLKTLEGVLAIDDTDKAKNKVGEIQTPVGQRTPSADHVASSSPAHREPSCPRNVQS